MADGRHFEKKTVKSPHLCNRLTYFDNTGYNDAYWLLTACLLLKFQFFWKTKVAAVAILKNHKNHDISVQVWPIFTKFGKLMQNGSLALWPLKNSNFTNPRWRKAAILKTVKSPYLSNHFTDFDEIWHDDVYWPPTVDRPLKFRIFENPRWRQPLSWKSQKSRYLCNGLTDLYESWYADAKWVS